jgi:hypothetical protein
MSKKNFDPLEPGSALGSTNTGNRSQASIGQVLLGEIAFVDADSGTCTVNTYSPSDTLLGCIWLTKSFTSPMLGYRVKSLPSEGTRVAVLVGNPSFIIGVVDNPEADEDHALSITRDGEFNREKYFEQEMYRGFEGSASLLEGEFEIENAFNVGIAFLTNLISVRAGDRAKIEAHLLHDMIRIIAEQYHSVTPLGDIRIFDDGRPNMEVTFGSYVHELLNLTSPMQDKVPNASHHVNFDALEDNDPIISFGHRFRAYIGFLGNFLNMFVADPLSNLTALASGKAQIHVGNSGDILLRTVSEIALERVVRVVVPQRIKDKTDAEGFLSKHFDQMVNSEVLKKWDYKITDLHHCAYSLRSYARYLSNHASLIRFHQMAGENNDKTFKIPKESELAPPDMHSKERDIQAMNGPSVFLEGYSTIRIFRDGSILSMDNEGGTVYHGRGIVEISSVKDIRMEAARDITIVAGRHFFLRSKKNMEVASSEGGIVMKSRALLSFLCEKGKLWLKSDAKKEPEEGESASYGIVLDAPHHSVLINSNNETVFTQEEGDLLIDSKKGAVMINAENEVVVNSKRKSVFLSAMDKVVTKSKSMFIDARKINIINKLVISKRELLINVKCFLMKSLRCKGAIFGPRVATRHRTSRGHSVPGTYNHIRLIKPEETREIEIEKSTELVEKKETLEKKYDELIVPFFAEFWKFQEHGLILPANTKKEALFIPFAQDFIETHSAQFSAYDSWEITKDFLNKAERTDSESLPWPTAEVKEENYSDFAVGEDLNKPSSKPSKEWDQPQIKTREIKRKVSK